MWLQNNGPFAWYVYNVMTPTVPEALVLLCQYQRHDIACLGYYLLP